MCLILCAVLVKMNILSIKYFYYTCLQEGTKFGASLAAVDLDGDGYVKTHCNSIYTYVMLLHLRLKGRAIAYVLYCTSSEI